MIFSYYFDAEKTHLLNCRFQVLQFSELALGFIELMFSAEMIEIQNGYTMKKESKVATFSFPPVIEGQEKHDVDFTRVRYAKDKKWIFTCSNNRQTDQKVEVGLISTTANKNPLGMDIYHDDEEFEVQLKANNLSILEPTYVAPVLNQTLVNATFDNPGLPERFQSVSASFNSTFKLVELSEFTQTFLEPIPVFAPFTITMDVAPRTVIPKVGTEIWKLEVANLGIFSLHTYGIEYVMHGGTLTETVRAFLDGPLTNDLFFHQGMKAPARLVIQGDGKGQLTFSYAGKKVTGTYDASQNMSQLSFRGAL